MTKILYFTLILILGILALDFLGFFTWSMSGQKPVDDMYLGSITAHIIKISTNIK